MAPTRRPIASRLAAVAALTVVLAPVPAPADPGTSALDPLLGEHLAYDVGFLFIERVGAATFTLERLETEGTYRAVFEARTLGLAALVTRKREKRYETVMELRDGRLRPVSHAVESSKRKGDKVTWYRKVYEYDHLQGSIRYHKVKTGAQEVNEVWPLPEGGSYDILTAFYSLRAGLLGPLEPGRVVELPALISGEHRAIEVRILTDEERGALTGFPSDGRLCRVKVDGEVFGTKDGAIYVWFDDASVPGHVVVEKVVGLGDLRGTLVRPQPAQASLH